MITALSSFFKLLVAGPNAFLGYTVKPNVYGSLAAFSGHTCNQQHCWLGWSLYSGHAKSVGQAVMPVCCLVHKGIFQNDDDQQLFITNSLVIESAEPSARLGHRFGKVWFAKLPAHWFAF